VDIQLAARVGRVKPSATIAITTKAAEYRAAGKDVIGLGAGEPDFDTPDHIKQAAINAIHQGKTRYTAVDGTPELKRAIQKKFKGDNGLDYDLDQILVSNGGKQSFYNLAQSLLDKGDEVIIPAPYWVSYPDMVLLADATPVIVKAGIDQGYKITPQQLEASITKKTRLLVLNSPSNPTGVVYSLEELKALADVLIKHPQVLVATDDMYEKIIWTEAPYANILNACSALYDRTIVLNGVSKAYAMTGWRIGYCAGPAALIKAMKKVQSQSTSNPCSVSQAAATAALEGSQQCLVPMVEAFKNRHQKAVERINQIQGMKAVAADGAFYAFPDCSELIKRLGLASDLELADLLMEKALVAVVPGSAFGLSGCIRLSYACSEETMAEALDRIERAVC
jgi:aspartate aminotransferase